MKKLYYTLCVSFLGSYALLADIPKSDELVQLHQVTTAEMNSIVSPEIGSLIFNSDDKEIYERNATAWKRISSSGDETKVFSGDCVDVLGTGTVGTPYTVSRSTPGKTKATAGLVCKQLYDTGCAMDSGMYWINPNGGSTSDAFEVYCDMTSDGGGWTRVAYASDLSHQQHFSGGDARSWLPSNFSLVLTSTQINDIRSVSTEGKQTYIGSCQGVIHYLYDITNFKSAFGFRFFNGDETVLGKQHYKFTNITVVNDGCKPNDGTLRSTTFEIYDIRVPIINVSSSDNGDSNEKFGSVLTSNPAWFR